MASLKLHTNATCCLMNAISQTHTDSQHQLLASSTLTAYLYHVPESTFHTLVVQSGFGCRLQTLLAAENSVQLPCSEDTGSRAARPVCLLTSDEVCTHVHTCGYT